MDPPVHSPIAFSLLSPLSHRIQTPPAGEDEGYTRTSSCIHINMAARGAWLEILGCHNSAAENLGLQDVMLLC
jgi:hypothetical protein